MENEPTWETVRNRLLVVANRLLNPDSCDGFPDAVGWDIAKDVLEHAEEIEDLILRRAELGRMQMKINRRNGAATTAEEVAGEFYRQLSAQFENTPAGSKL